MDSFFLNACILSISLISGSVSVMAAEETIGNLTHLATVGHIGNADHEWPPVICFSVADAKKFLQVLDRAPQPPSPNFVFHITRENSIRCTTVHVPLTFGALVTTLSLENYEYDIVNVEAYGRRYYSVARRPSQRS